MTTDLPEQINEPVIGRQDLLVLQDDDFCPENVCVVTGCGTGIGRAVALAAAVNQLHVVGLDINAEAGKQTRQMALDMGGQMTFEPADLTRDADIEAGMATAAKQGNVKFLVNIAGIQHIDPVSQFPMETYDLMQRLMLRAPFYLSQLAIQQMQTRGDGTGVIAHMASVHAHICTAKKPVYNITKFGLRALSQSISAEGAGKIRSFTVSTGFVKTPLALNQIPAQAAQRGISPEQVVSEVMMGRSQVKQMMSPAEVANLFIFGLSHHGRYLVGGDMLFDGGMVLTY